MRSSLSSAAPEREVIAGLVERVTFHSPDNGFCVLRVKIRGHRDLVTVVGHAPTIGAGEFLQATGSWPQCIIGTPLYGSARRGGLNGALSGAVLGDNPRDGWLADAIEARHLGARLAP